MVVLKLGARLQFADRDIMYRFIAGLPERLGFFVRAGRPVDHAQPSVSLLMEKIDKLAAGVEHLRTSQNSVTKTPKGKVSYGHRDTGTRSHRSEQRDGGGFRHSNVNTECSKCQGTGHNDPACKWNGEGRVNPEVKCQLCKQTGHTAVKCADREKPKCPKLRGPPAWEFVRTNTTTDYGSTTVINRRSA